MRRWLLLLAGPLIWAAHFMAIYAVTSISYVVAGATTAEARLVVVALSLAGLGGCAGVLLLGLREDNRDELAQFWRAVATAGLVVAAVAILWQTLPALAPIEGTAPTVPS